MLVEKFDHETIEKPGLFDLTGVAGAWQDLQFTIRYAPLERERALMGTVLAPGQDRGWTGDTRMMALRLWLLESPELVKDRVQIGEFIAFGK